MRRQQLLVIAGIGAALAGLAAFGSALVREPSAAPSPTPPAEPWDIVVAAPGRVEPISEEIKVAAELDGKLSAVLVDEGQRVARGQALAVLENSDFRARLAAAEADLARREAELRRVVNGARTQERREAAAAVREAEAVLDNARIEWNRRLRGYQEGVFPREDADRAERELGVARGRYEAALERWRLVEDEAREEDRSRAEAEVALARARLDEARALLEKTTLRSPLDGVVLRRHLRAGESVSPQREAPIVTLADTSVKRVRVDVDETDIGRVFPGQRGYVTADAFPGRRFWGQVVRVGEILGRKNVRTDQPTERVDTKVLETLLELEDGGELPVGLRVDAFLVLDRRPAR